LILAVFLCAASSLGASETELSLADTLSRLGGTISWDPFFRQGRIEAAGHRAAFSAGEKGQVSAVVFDRSAIYKAPSPWTENGTLVFPENFVDSLKEMFDYARSEDMSRFRIAAIIVDPGHGG
jgi:N-acetylmuramoyl-L-alanine amidase